MEVKIICKHRINYKQRYKSCVKINGIVLRRALQSTPKDVILSNRGIIKIYTCNLHYSYSLEGLCAL